MCLVTVLCKVFPLKAPAALFSPLQLFPVAILQQCREDQLLYYQQQDPVDSEGKNAGKRQHLWEIWSCASQAHNPVLLHLFFPVKGSVIPSISLLGWRQSRKSENMKIIFKNTIIFIKYRVFGGGKKRCLLQIAESPSAAGKSPGMSLPRLW